jgi:hypothetical protein
MLTAKKKGGGVKADQWAGTPFESLNCSEISPVMGSALKTKYGAKHAGCTYWR